MTQQPLNYEGGLINCYIINRINSFQIQNEFVLQMKITFRLEGYKPKTMYNAANLKMKLVTAEVRVGNLQIFFYAFTVISLIIPVILSCKYYMCLPDYQNNT